MDVRTSEEKLAEGLAWASLGLGVALIAAPGHVNRLAGIRDDETTRFWARAVGIRELGAFGLIKFWRARPAVPVWTRVAGDAKDLTLLGLAARSKLESRSRWTAATANIAAITALDAFTALKLSRGGTTEAPGGEPPDDLTQDPAYEPPPELKAFKGG